MQNVCHVLVLVAFVDKVSVISGMPSVAFLFDKCENVSGMPQLSEK
jgi:hypothetical protein